MDNPLITLSSVTALLTPLVLFLASCYYIAKRAKADSILLFIGSGIDLIASTFFVLIPFFAQSINIPFAEASNYYGIAGIISFLGGICFVTGFFILINDSVKAHMPKKM
jgi:hypothetical protein